MIDVTRYITINTNSGLKANNPFLFEICCMSVVWFDASQRHAYFCALVILLLACGR